MYLYHCIMMEVPTTWDCLEYHGLSHKSKITSKYLLGHLYHNFPYMYSYMSKVLKKKFVRETRQR